MDNLYNSVKTTCIIFLNKIYTLSILQNMKIKTFKEIIEMWPSISELADDMGESYITVNKWHVRDNIPVRRWVKLLKSAKNRKIPITAELMVKLAAGKVA